MKKCKTCGIEKSLTEFYKTKNAKDGYAVECKACNKIRRDAWRKEHKDRARANQKRWQENNRDKQHMAEKKWRKNNPDKVRNQYLLYNYGITLEEYNQLLKKQNNGCAICGRHDLGLGNRKALAVDHDHKTGEVRGLLCGPCNYLIGLAKDDFFLLHKASEYLKVFFEYEKQ